MIRRAIAWVRSRLPQSNRAVFSSIHARAAWGSDGAEPCSGAGSRGALADAYVDAIRTFICENNIRTVVDVGCGDYAIGSRISPLVDHYTGIDVVPRLIERHRRLSSDKIHFLCMDAAKGNLPSADLCLIRQVLQHLSNRDIARIIKQFDRFDWIIATEHHPTAADFTAHNLDKRTGEDIRAAFGSGVYLDRPPFGLHIDRCLLDLPFDLGVDRPDMRGHLRTLVIRPGLRRTG
jgi:Methyltransferase domain